MNALAVGAAIGFSVGAAFMAVLAELARWVQPAAGQQDHPGGHRAGRAPPR